jgi:DNA-binding transcriptional regulator YiaG
MATASNWKDVRARAVESGKLDDGRVRSEATKLLGEVRMHRLAEIRESLGITQQALAALMGVTQARVSQIERGELESTELATLRRYLRELGVEVEVTAHVGDDRLQIA